MIEITKDKKGECYIITQTKNIEGIDFHYQITLSKDELRQLSFELDNYKLY